MVRDRRGRPQEGVPVALAGPGGSETQTTTTDGCAFFAYQPAGAYTVTLSRASYVSDQGVASSGAVRHGRRRLHGLAAVPVRRRRHPEPALLGNTGGAAPGERAGHARRTPTSCRPGKKTFAGIRQSSHDHRSVPVRRRLREHGRARCPDADPEGVDRRRALLLPRRQPHRADRSHRRRHERRRPSRCRRSWSRRGRPSGRAPASGRRSRTSSHAAPTIRLPSGETYALGTTDAAGDLITAALPYGTWTISAAGPRPRSVSAQPAGSPRRPTVTVIVRERPR